MELRPEILQQHNIPQPMHGTNPRSVLGRGWWDEHRQEAYAKMDYHCWACGVHKQDALYHQWLEGHESYDIDYEQGTMKLNEIVALCHACHNFIHNGRMYSMHSQGKYNYHKMTHILARGMKILRANDLKPPMEAILVSLLLQGESEHDATRLANKLGVPHPDAPMAPWGQWRLIIDGKEYPSKFANETEWQEHYLEG